MIAFDYSMTSPAMCISPDATWANAKVWFLSDKKKHEDIFLNGKIVGAQHWDWFTPEQRYHNISEHFIRIVAKEAANAETVIEDYSMGSKGKVFNIGENTGLLKHKLWTRDHKLILVPPTVLKKFATGKGNADKLQMHEAFLKETGEDLLSLGKPGTNPSSDIIDAYYLLKYAFTLKESKTTIETP